MLLNENIGDSSEKINLNNELVVFQEKNPDVVTMTSKAEEGFKLVNKKEVLFTNLKQDKSTYYAIVKIVPLIENTVVVN